MLADVLDVGDEVLRRVGASAISEGATEGAQQVWQNLVASSLVGYDPDREFTQDMVNSIIVGAAVGRFAPSFVTWLASPGLVFNAQPNAFDPTEFGFGLGTVCGLFLGAGTGLFLVVVLALRDAWLARAELGPVKPPREHAFD